MDGDGSSMKLEEAGGMAYFLVVMAVEVNFCGFPYRIDGFLGKRLGKTRRSDASSMLVIIFRI